jgi:hypothetical protein
MSHFFAKTVLRFLRAFVLYLGIVIGGITLFLMLAPLVGYLPYSDRPGSGWFGVFPALGWQAFWGNAWRMLEMGVGFARLFVRPAMILAVVMLLFERLCHQRTVVRVLGGTLGGLIAGYFMLAIGWYIAADSSLLVLAVLLGAVAGITMLPGYDVDHVAIE